MAGKKSPDSTVAAAAPPRPGELLLLLINAPLYHEYPLVGHPETQVRDLRGHEGNFDMYCPWCKRSSTWRSWVNSEVIRRRGTEAGMVVPSRDSAPQSWVERFSLHAFCARDRAHFSIFHFEPSKRALPGSSEDADSSRLIKVGQYPSLSDFQIGDLGQIEEGMTAKQRKEFVRAINTGAHGFAVAACVYYRRVFESVLRDARDEHLRRNQLAAWPEFERARNDERIKMLAAELPAFLSEHPHLYAILSLGVHELTEEQCAEELPVLRQAIELILHERVIAKRRKKQRDEVSRLVAQSVDKHKNA